MTPDESTFYTNCCKCGRRCYVPRRPTHGQRVYCRDCNVSIKREERWRKTRSRRNLGRIITWCAILLVILLVGSWAYNEVTTNDYNLDGTVNGIEKTLNDIIYPPIYSQSLMIDGNTYAAYPNGSHCYATIYRNATDPTYAQLMAFLQQDDTAYATYIPGVYVCANFAVHLSDDAERNGIKAHLVSVSFIDNDDHMLDAFNTTDRGMVFIDATGQTAENKAAGAPSSPCIVDLQVGSPYILNPIYPTYGWSLRPLGTVSSYKIMD